MRPHARAAVSTYVWLRTKRRCKRLKPSFLIVGAPKAGTTSLFLYLSGHPRIAEPVVKEIHYFSHYWSDRSDAWYLAHFPSVRRSGVITGEASPGYLDDPESPARVLSVLPDAKIIVLLRDPVARAISHYHHDINIGVRERRELVDYLAFEGMKLRPELTSRLISHSEWAARPMKPSADEPWPPTYIRQGLYAEQLENWFKYLSRDQFLIMKAEDLFADPKSAYARALSFLGLPFFNQGPMEAHNVGRYGSTNPAVLQYLSALYEEPNRRLYELLGVDLGWSRAS